MKKIELLAPAGSLLKMKTAFAYGADAVYLGIPAFSMRVRINQFTLSEVKKAVKYAHDLNKKVYVTINIIAHNRHFKKLPAYVRELKKMKVDALIVSDPGMMEAIRQVWSKAEIHLSTQANCSNLETARFWWKQGVKRIVLGREVTLQEIKEIHRALPKLELEYFIHGAMCMAYSGRCFLSKQLLGRSANLGDCAQPCRWEYSLSARGHEEEGFELVEEVHGSYILNSKDLCLIRHIEDLISAGVISLKIEGRAKSVYYQATVCSVYHRALYLLRKKIRGTELKEELNRLFAELKTKLVHRGYTTGFLMGDRAEQNIADARNSINWEFCGQVEKVEKDEIIFKVHNTIKEGDQIEIIGPNYDIIKLKVKDLKNAKTGEKLNEAHGGGGGQTARLKIASGTKVPVYAVLRRKIKE